MPAKASRLLASALCAEGAHLKTEAVLPWLAARKEANPCTAAPIPLEDLEGWTLDGRTGNLGHQSGRFFTIEGIQVETNFGHVPRWSQPIINQPEIGILGFLAKEFGGVLHFLVQAKMEPGNIGLFQLAPTVQATRSNFTRAHGGGAPPYLEYFTGAARVRVLTDILQSEQGARFLRKRNRNMIVETKEEVPLCDDYCWLTLGQLQRLIQFDNVVNMDARTVVSCIPLRARELIGTPAQDAPRALVRSGCLPTGQTPDGLRPFGEAILRSILDAGSEYTHADEIISWLTALKIRYELHVESIPLNDVHQWGRRDGVIAHDSGGYFQIIGVRAESSNREVPAWTQPLVKPMEEGIVAFLVRPIGGVAHVLVQGKVEPGNFDVVEMAPTVQCITGNYIDDIPENWPPYLDYVLQAPASRIRHQSMQSEEGGRFYREENRNLIIEVDEDFPLNTPPNFIWMTLGQLKEFVKYNNYVNVEARCLSSALSFLC